VLKINQRTSEVTALGERIGVKGSYPRLDLLLSKNSRLAVFRGSVATDWKDRDEELELERTGLDSGSNESPGEREMMNNVEYCSDFG
jgi:hypothetical protein